ncbi:MAG: hypothetical protein AMXMBFR34_24050 [Myxococcaceae bacterium]
MRWIDTPPCVSLEIAEDSPKRLLLKGPSKSARFVSGANAAMGGLFAGVGLKLLRLPIPGPFKLIPLAFAAVGGGLAAYGAATALANVSLEVDKKGLTARWKAPAFPQKSLHLGAKEVAGFEITSHVYSARDTFGDERAVYEHRLVVVTKAGRALPLESFFTRTQAELRREAIEAHLGR